VEHIDLTAPRMVRMRCWRTCYIYRCKKKLP